MSWQSCAEHTRLVSPGIVPSAVHTEVNDVLLVTKRVGMYAVDEVKIKKALHCLVQAVYTTDQVEILRWLKECRRTVVELIAEQE